MTSNTADPSAPVGEAVWVIAEAGVNHNGEADLAFALVDAAAAAGADAVKFQTFRADRLVTRAAAKAAYQERNSGGGESQHQMLKRLELDFELHHRLKAHAERQGIAFLSTAFDSGSLRFLVDSVGLKTLKLPSGELTNGPFLLEHARSGCERLLVSTGMASLGEVEQALQVIAYGFLHPAGIPDGRSLAEAYADPGARRLVRQRVVLLHCTSEYPAALPTVNLRAMDSLAQAFGLPVGYSDHTEGIVIPAAAAARGARVIEKHYTLDRNLPGPDHRASLEPPELTAMVASIRAVEQALGDGGKRPQAGEWDTARVARKSVVAACAIAAGEPFAETNLTLMRPGNGLSPMAYWDLLGRPARRNYGAGDAIVD